jgi:hypothetical protein
MMWYSEVSMADGEVAVGASSMDVNHSSRMAVTWVGAALMGCQLSAAR